jgi:hypothetical protein
MTPNNVYGLLPQVEDAIRFDDRPGKCLQSYIRHREWDRVSRADMESASARRQSLRAAMWTLPALLSASRAVAVARLAMMGDCSSKQATVRLSRSVNEP